MQNKLIAAFALLPLLLCSCEEKNRSCITNVNLEKNEAVGLDMVVFTIKTNSELIDATKENEIAVAFFFFNGIEEEDLNPRVSYNEDKELIEVYHRTSLFHPSPEGYSMKNIEVELKDTIVKNYEKSLLADAKLALQLNTGVVINLDQCR